MKRSHDRILTTHTGSLPRPNRLLKLLKDKEAGKLSDRASFERQVKKAVKDAVRMQTETAIDVVNDGEMSKVGYSTYVTDRLTGFSGDSERRLRVADVADFPGFEKRWARDRSVRTLRRPLCTGPVSYRGQEELQADTANLTAALSGVNPAEAFMSAASPGVISLFLENRHYPNHEAYIFAVAEAMKHEYDAIHRAGFILQLD
ncbi:MAG: epoxyalkane--coenzyme M transferase, partial [Candidatus Binataceae bacterium]